MSTVATLAATQQLRSISVRLAANEQPWRTLYATTRLTGFLGEVMAENPPSRCEADLTPKQQLNELFRDFICGEELVFDEQYHALWPGEQAVWELKTPDIRIFGWFAQKDCFIGVVSDFADRIKNIGLYAGYRDEVARFRRECGAEDTLCIWETGPYDVISVRD